MHMFYNAFSEASKDTNDDGVSTTRPETTDWRFHNVVNGKVESVGHLTDLWALKSNQYHPWKDLLEYSKMGYYSNSCQAAQKRLFGTPIMAQALHQCMGDDLNTDYYAIMLSSLPPGHNCKTLCAYLRIMFPTFTASYSVLEPYVKSERKIWQSTDCVSCVMRFNTPLDDLSVVVTEAADSYWIMTPVTSPLDAGHPLGGHRQFGLAESKYGGKTCWVFYTRAVDRPYMIVDVVAKNKIFDGADTLWKVTMMSTASFISRNWGIRCGDLIAFSRQISWDKDVIGEDKKVKKV